MTTRAYAVQESILEECLAQLQPNPARVVVVPGATPVWDACCDGMLYSAMVGVQPKLRAAKCTGWTATIKVGVIRCCASLDDMGNPPTPHQISQDARLMLDDMVALMRALAASECVEVLDGWEPLGPDGGCAGGEWTITVHLPLELPVG